MEEIVKTTRYWLFKCTNEKYNYYYYTRIKIDGLDSVSWSLGYKNQLGLVSLIGGTLDRELSKSLENEFQAEINKNRKEVLNYKIKI